MRAKSRPEEHVYLCVLERTDAGFSGFVPDLMVMSTGRTKDDVLKGLSENVQLYAKHGSLPNPSRSLVDLAKEYSDDDVEFDQVKAAEDNVVSRDLDRLFVAEKVTHAHVARLLNVSRAAVSRLVNPFYHGHSLDALRRVAHVLGYEVEVSFKKVVNN